ncbi:flavin reductase family protein [Agromyces sp. Marseille-Q5079]|uniref:flavin reductase family protein n=1 Tax=Agromyces sp. Marseille-Q5079 TaxID=3439059 RepID=UPI003D9C9E40
MGVLNPDPIADGLAANGAPPTLVPATIEAFKAAFRDHPAGVALVTATTPLGPVGLTASSVASVSAEPAALSFSVTRATGSAGGLLAAETIVVHLLAAGQVEVARAFARSGAPRFTPEQGWSSLPTGEPWLVEAPVALRARVIHTLPVGGSSLVVAEVLDVRLGERAPSLVYRDRRFHALDDESPQI